MGYIKKNRNSLLAILILLSIVCIGCKSNTLITDNTSNISNTSIIDGIPVEVDDSDKSVEDITEEPVAQDKPVEKDNKLTDETEELVETPVEEPVETPDTDEAQNPVETPNTDETEKPVETPNTDETEKPVETPNTDETEKPVETPTEKPVETPTEKPVETPTEKPVETPNTDETEKPVETPTEKPVETPTKDTNSVEIKINPSKVFAPYAGVYTVDMNPIYEKSAETKLAPASTTKIITAATALKYVDPNHIVTVGDELDLVHYGSSLCYVKKGYRMTLYDLLHGLLLPSGNDAAYVIAANTTDVILGENTLTPREKVDYFCNLMTETAKEFGATNSNFVNPEGWDNDNHYTTVKDLACIAKHAMDNPIFREIVKKWDYSTKIESGQSVYYKSTNPLLKPNGYYFRSNAIGVKTGNTDNAGKCLVSMIQAHGTEYIVIAMGCDGYGNRNMSIVNMIDTINKAY